MSRFRAVAYAALVTLVAFYYLAAPTLQELYGPAAVLPAYAAVALLAGVATYHLVAYATSYERDDDEPRPLGDLVGPEVDGEAAAADAEEAADGDDVDEMLREVEGEQ